MGVLLLDSRDSFTHNIKHAFLMLGVPVVVKDSARLSVRDVEKTMRQNALKLVCVGPGPRAPKDVEGLLELLKALHQRVPLLGICLGLQAFVQAFGGSLKRANEPVHGKRRDCFHDGRGIFDTLPSPFQVMRYHSLVADELPPIFEVSARDKEGQVMGLRDLSHEDAPLWAVQFHPESIGSEYGLKLLSNALSLAAIDHRECAKASAFELGFHWAGAVV